MEDIDKFIHLDHVSHPDEAAPWRRAEAHNNVGVDQLQAGNLDPAAAHFRRAIELRHEYDPNPFNLIASAHLAGLAHFNLGLVELERAKRIESAEERRQLYENAIREFLKAISIGDRAPRFQPFVFDAHRWVATIRHDFGVFSNPDVLDLDGFDKDLQYLMLSLVEAEDGLIEFQNSRQVSSLRQAKTKYLEILSIIDERKIDVSNRHIKRILDVCNRKIAEIDEILSLGRM